MRDKKYLTTGCWTTEKSGNHQKLTMLQNALCTNKKKPSLKMRHKQITETLRLPDKKWSPYLGHRSDKVLVNKKSTLY